MTGFAALMALSASQTKEAQSAVQTALLERQRNEEMKRKKREEFERKEREEQAKLRRKHFEEEKKQQELEAKRAADMARLETEKARREEEARNALVYGPKKTKWPTSNGTAKDEVRKRRFPSDDEGDSRSGSPAMALTREEKRQRRLEAELRRSYSAKRSSIGAGYSKAGRRLPGGAIDATSAPLADSESSAQSVKARLTALPNTLTKLNVNKRDTRTIDEILQDRAKAKHGILDGEEAREFNDWFGKSKKKEPVPSSSQSSSGQGSGSASSAASPLSSGAKSTSQLVSKASTASKTATVPSAGKSASSGVQPRAAIPAKAGVSAAKSARDDTRSTPSVTKPSQAKGPSAPIKAQPSKSTSASRAVTGSVLPKKRAHSSSCSASPPPKRRAESPADAIRSEIWKLFGRDRAAYVTRDIDSDDDDMEADASAVMTEELRSSRLAKREDELALLEEKRHEEEKRRRKREREVREKRG
ncbi:SPT2 chromatin protein-domain-containing protein [Pisolithus thermaeus]|nr:SPT2 chromatin protein-domain-containing protein [Pisolithus croceorrhizus]KAI6167957.1 SPT2 chromatin protein-domain-containing protein [Pisolithus thermaeus]